MRGHNCPLVDQMEEANIDIFHNKLMARAVEILSKGKTIVPLVTMNNGIKGLVGFEKYCLLYLLLFIVSFLCLRILYFAF